VKRRLFKKSSEKKPTSKNSNLNDGGNGDVRVGSADLFTMAAKKESSKETNTAEEDDLLTAAFFSDLRQLQNRCKCTEAMCADITKMFGKHMGIKQKCGYRSAAKKHDKILQEAAGVECLSIHGCIGCNKFVYTPGDDRTHCPFRKSDNTICGHPRFDDNNKPHEVRGSCYYTFYCIF